LKDMEKYSPPRYPLYAISLYKDRKGTLCMKETSNLSGKGVLCKASKFSGLDANLFRSALGNSKLLDKDDREFVNSIFLTPSSEAGD